MKTFKFALLLNLLVSFPIAASADDPAYVVATNFPAEGKVLELDIPPEIDGVRFVIGVENSDSATITIVAARAGRHCYEVRHLPQWSGTIKYIATTRLEGVT